MAALELEPKESHSKMKNKKRKLKGLQKTERPSKSPRLVAQEEPKRVEKPKQRELSPESEEGRPWRNLELILLIQNKELNTQKKVEAVFSFVNSKLKEKDQFNDTVKRSRLIVFVSDWVQSLLISSEKKAKDDVGKHCSVVLAPCLDYRCWEIFKFCLEESGKVHITLNLSRNLLHAFYFVTRNAISLLVTSMSSKEQFFYGDGFKLYNFVLDCVSFVFSPHLGLSNENLDSWISTIGAVLDFAHKICEDNLVGGDVGAFAMKFSCMMLEAFAKFLWIHPTKKNGFHNFVDKLLEPLLLLLGNLSVKTDVYSHGWTRKLMNLLEEVLSHALFHTVHIDGFLGLHGSVKFSKSHSEKFEDSKAVIKSYHRHLFDKLQKLVAGKKFLALSAVGELFHLLVVRVKKVKGASSLFEDIKVDEKMICKRPMTDDIANDASYALQEGTNLASEKNNYPSNLSTKMRKSLFEFFIHILEPLLSFLDHIRAESILGPTVKHAHCLLRSINSILASFMKEKIYLRTEDSSEGAYLNFLRNVYDTIMSISTNLLLLSRHEIENSIDLEVLFSVANEILVAVGYLLEIEYDVIGDDLVTLWLVTLSYSAINLSFTNIPGQHLLTSRIQELVRQLVDIYGQLRQVDISIFALCKAMRSVAISNEGETEKSYACFMTSIGNEAYGKSAGMLLSSQEFKFAIHKAIKNLPEGQASGIIRQLTEDLVESVGWLRLCNSNLTVRNSTSIFDLQTELLGSGLSEVYALMLDSLVITSGNAFQIGTSIENLISITRPYMSSLVGLKSDGAKTFLFTIMEKRSNDMVADKDDSLEFGMTSHWIFVCFFRLYMSCRSLYRQAISLVPPSKSRKMSATVGDSFIAFSAYDFMQRTDWSDEGYFSWILQPSASVLAVAQSVSSLYHQGSNTDWCPLIYVLHTIALQRLVDLNRHIKSLEYLHQRNENLMQVDVLDNDGLSVCQKKSKMFGRLISSLKKEASGLTDFMMRHLSLVAKSQISNPPSRNGTSDDKSSETLHQIDDWDFSICNVNKKSLPTAVWWIVCQNVDIWSIHAAKGKLKMFLSFLLRTSHPFLTINDLNLGTQQTNGCWQLKKVSLQQISSAVLSDPTFYEQRFVCRYMPSRFCRELKALVFLSSHDKASIDISITSTDWLEVIAALESSTVDVCSGKDTSDDNSSLAKAVTHSSDMLNTETIMLKKDSPLSHVRYRACQRLIKLLCWMPKGNIGSKSFTLYMTYVLNLERLLVNALVSNQNASCPPNQFELLRLFVSCRRALKNLLIASFEAGSRQCTSVSVLSEDKLPVSWLFKSMSIVIRLQGGSSENGDVQVKDAIFSLMDHTLYLILTTSKYQFKNALRLITIDNKPRKEQYRTDVSHEPSDGVDLYFDPTCSVEVCNSAFQVASSLKELAEGELNSLKRSNVAVGDGDNVAIVHKLLPLASCLNGFLWGLASAVDYTDLRNGNHYMRSMKLNWEYHSQLNLCINAFSELLSLFLEMFLDGGNQQLTKLCDYQNLPDHLGVKELSVEGSSAEADTSFSKCHELESCHNDGDSKNPSLSRKGLLVENKSRVATILNEANLIEMQSLNKSFLQGLLKGFYPEVACALKQLFIAASVILRLHMQYGSTPLSSSSMAILIGISCILLQELVNMIEVPQPSVLAWLDGVLKYLEELGHLFPFADTVQSRNLYSNIVDLHLKTIGKCIYLQGKRATLASHETESTTKTLDGRLGLLEASSFPGHYCIDEFKAGLRMSFKVLVRKASELHLLSAIQAIERALIGVQEHCTVIYELNSGSEDGGRCSFMVAAGVECLDLVLEFVSGRKCLGVVKRHMQSLIAGLFSIVLHLQSPLIFYAKMMDMKDRGDPDPGSVILMCVEVLTRVSGKHALFQMDAWHIAQCLRIPAALFEDFSQLKLSRTSTQSENSFFSSQPVSELGRTTSNSVVDRQFLIDLFAASCRLLYTVLKHHKSECKHCIAQVEASVSVLLHSLERVAVEPECTSGYFSWELEEGVKCACFLRRIYEEIRQQKDVISRHCSLFLANYISVYSGYGPLKSGIKREIDEALRPGIYALIDACSAEDLQYLHTVFGEGPCRNTLATLQQDYKQFFQYEGKV